MLACAHGTKIKHKGEETPHTEVRADICAMLMKFCFFVVFFVSHFISIEMAALHRRAAAGSIISRRHCTLRQPLG